MRVLLRPMPSLPGARDLPQTLDLPGGASVADALAALDLAPEGLVILKNSGPAGPDTPLDPGCTLELLPIVEGG